MREGAMVLAATAALALSCAASRHGQRATCNGLVEITANYMPAVEELLRSAPPHAGCAIAQERYGTPLFLLWVEDAHTEDRAYRAVVQRPDREGEMRTYSRPLGEVEAMAFSDMACRILAARASNRPVPHCHLSGYAVRYGGAMSLAGEPPPTFRVALTMNTATVPLSDLENAVQALAAYVTAPEDLAPAQYLYFRSTLAALDQALWCPECDA